jgi:rhamnulokinase
MGIESFHPRITPESLAHNFTNEGGVAGTFRFLKNIAGLWLIQECRRGWGLEDGAEVRWEELDAAAAAAKPFKCFLDPDDPLFIRPANMPQAILDYCRRTEQPAPQTRGEMVRAVLQSLALKYRLVRDSIEETAGVKIEVLHVVGGGSRNELLNRFSADALGVLVMAGPVEATAIGNLIVQAVAQGRIPDLAAARALVRRSFPLRAYEPGPDLAQWEAAAERFKEIIKREHSKTKG